MARKLDLKRVVKHLINGTLGENLCRVCLLPLDDVYENIFTKICTENEEYCIADILKELYDLKISDSDHYNVCSDCHTSILNAYKFYLNAKRNDLLLHLYADNLLNSLNSIDKSTNYSNESIFIFLPLICPDIPSIEFDPCKKIGVNKAFLPVNNEKKVNVKVDEINKIPFTEMKNSKIAVNPAQLKTEQDEDDDDELVIIMNEKGQPSFFKMKPDGKLVEVEYNDKCRNAYKVITEQMPKIRVHNKKREPMAWKKCTKCPTKYRFVAKLREHMLQEHGIWLYSCKICHILIENEDEYQFHIKTHTNKYKCDICDSLFKKRETIIAHLELHEKLGERKQNMFNFVCKSCGKIMKDEESLNIHIEEHKYKEYTCYYCGRMYKRELGFNNHIKKHEMYLKLKEIRKKKGEKNAQQSEKQLSEQQRLEQKCSKELTCEVCGRTILSERALLWHKRLHTNERPFTCKECGRAFVSLNRCKQHALCAHTAPARRCPLCPALFHMRSMVNSHIKKVHLNSHKRGTRAVRHKDVFWHTEPVPIQELSVALQDDILELQTAKNTASDDGVFAD